MSKTVFFNIPAQGHINPSLPVVTELTRRGEEVVYVNTEDIRAQIEPTGARFYAYTEMKGVKELMAMAGSGNIPDNALMLTQIGERALPQALELLRTERPDYVIFDSLAAWGKYAAQLLSIPSIASISTLLIPPGSRPPFTLGMLLKTVGQIIPVHARILANCPPDTSYLRCKT